MEVVRLRTRQPIAALALAGPGLAALGVALALDADGRPRLLLGYAVAAVVAAALSSLFRVRAALRLVEGAEPLPADAVEVSRPLRDALLVVAISAVATGVVFAIAAAGGAVLDEPLSHALVAAGGVFSGDALASLVGNRALERWQARNGALFTQPRFAFRRRPLYVERHAAAPE